MEEKKQRSNQVFLAVIGIATLLVAVIGATFAYFSANTVTGNVEHNTVIAQTAQYGDIVVDYDDNHAVISTGEDPLDLPYTEIVTAGGVEVAHKYYLLFTVRNGGNIDQNVTIQWINVTNGFCNYATSVTARTCAESAGVCAGSSAPSNEVDCTSANGQWAADACTDYDANFSATACAACGGSWTGNVDVSGEISYQLYELTDVEYAGIDSATAIETNGDSRSGGVQKPAPRTGASDNVLDTASINILGNNETKYFGLVLTVTNLTRTQNYNQDKSFVGAITVGVLNN